MEPREIVSRVTTLVSLPEVCRKVNEMVADGRSSAADIGAVVACDPGLATRLLRVVNSAYYGLPRKVETIAHAVALVGMEDLRQLVLATSAGTAFRRLPVALIDVDRFWHHSVYVATAARALAAGDARGRGERWFTAGLLHDVGQLVLCHEVPDLYRPALERAPGGGAALAAAEAEVLGFGHAAVGAELLRQWGIPEATARVVEFHHDPARAPGGGREAAVLWAADGLGLASGRGGAAADSVEIPGSDPRAWTRSGLSRADLAVASAKAEAQTLDLLEFIFGDYAQIY